MRASLKDKRAWRVLAALMALSMVAAACGDDDDTAAPETTAAPAATDTTAAPAPAPAPPAAAVDVVAAGTAAAGEPIELPAAKVGYLQWVYADEAGKRIEDAAKEAVEFLGWEYETCDAGGDQAKMSPCGNGLLDKEVDVIMVDGIPEAFITDVLERAAEEGVPVITGGGEVDPRDFYIASFASDDTDLGVQLAEHLKTLLPDGGDIIVQSFPSTWSAKRQTGLASVLEGSNINIVDTFELVPDANMVGSTEADITTKLQQFPDVKAVWIDFSVASIGAANAIASAFPDAADPARPKLLTFYANPGTVADIRTGRVDAAVDEKLEWQSWAGADALAQLLAREIEPSQERAPDFGGVNFSVRQVITPANVPAEGAEVPSPVDYETFFRTKWCAEFTNLPSCT